MPMRGMAAVENLFRTFQKVERLFIFVAFEKLSSTLGAVTKTQHILNLFIQNIVSELLRL